MSNLIPFEPREAAWRQYYKDQAAGKPWARAQPYNKKRPFQFGRGITYIHTPKVNPIIKMISPAKAVLDRAESQIKREREKLERGKFGKGVPRKVQAGKGRKRQLSRPKESDKGGKKKKCTDNVCIKKKCTKKCEKTFKFKLK